MTRKQRFAANGNPEKDIRYSYNYQGQLQESKDSTITTGTYRYNHKRQRVYSDMRMGTSTGDGIKWYYWDAGGRNIGEGHQRYGDYTVRYIYSGNEKIAMARPKDLDNMAAGEEILYFINNAQGTPVMVVNEAGTVESRINMDEWGNLGDNTDKSEVNLTGKKLDPSTNLYYFNQRYYDPEIGRFLTPDPAGQALNPYLYCGNNPNGFIDPDGAWFVSDWMKDFGKTAGFVYGATQAYMNHGSLSQIANSAMQGYAVGGVIGGVVGSYVESSILSAGMAYGVGSLGEAWNLKDNLVAMTAMHGISGGIQSSVSGGNFWSGFAGGSIANVAGTAVDGMDNNFAKIGIAGLGGGIGSWAAGGDFGRGFLIGAGVEAFNHLGGGIFTVMDPGGGTGVGSEVEGPGLIETNDLDWVMGGGGLAKAVSKSTRLIGKSAKNQGERLFQIMLDDVPVFRLIIIRTKVFIITVIPIW